MQSHLRSDPVVAVDTLIVGGGLSGLYAAHLLTRQGACVHIVEARDRLGGRILTEETAQGYFDLGPAWFWPGQPRIQALVIAFGLDVFEQYATGSRLFEDSGGAVLRDVGFSSMQGSLRLVGGMSSLIKGLALGLPDDAIHLNTAVTYIKGQTTGLTVGVTTAGQHGILQANRVILALPPRVIAEHITFEPALSTSAMVTLANRPTWMAGQAKVVATYDRPFWRDAGFSGDAMSQRGPLVEIHDASPLDGRGSGLFGFVGVPATARQDQDVALKAAVCQQLGRLFGEQATTPTALHLKDWAFEVETATKADMAPVFAHPTYGFDQSLRHVLEDRLFFAGTEMARQFGGYLEGALEAAEATVEMMQSTQEKA